MKTIEIYECETCGKRFESEDECYQHEMEHSIAGAEGHVQMWNGQGVSLPLCFASYEEAMYLHIKDEIGHNFIALAANDVGAYTPYDDTGDDIGYFVYSDCNNEWISINRQIERANGILEIFGFDPIEELK